MPVQKVNQITSAKDKLKHLMYTKNITKNLSNKYSNRKCTRLEY